MEIVRTQKARNFHYEVVLKDYTIVKDYIMELKPKREKGIKYSNWIKSLEGYNNSYSKRPYWVQVILWDDDDLIIQKEFSTLEDAESLFMELATCQSIPDFDKLGLR